MVVILYHSKHGSTAKIARVISTYLTGQCELMDLDAVIYSKLAEATTIVCGAPIYYGALDPDMVRFIKENQAFLIARNYSLYIVGLQYAEFMDFVTKEFDYQTLKHIRVIAGLGGAVYFPKLTRGEKMAVSLVNKRIGIIPKDYHKDIFENFDNKEIQIFADKIARIENNSQE